MNDAFEAQLTQAIQYRNDDQLEEARDLFADLFARNPHHARVNYHFAWLHDKFSEEARAVPFYENAIQLGLADEELKGALLGLGSTYRCVGRYNDAIKTLQQGMDTFPNALEFRIFMAMTFHNLGKYAEAMNLLLTTLAETSNHAGIQQYKRAIAFYANRLDEIWT